MQQEYRSATLEPTYETLVEINRLCSRFKDEGKDRMLSMLEKRSRNPEEIERLTSYIRLAIARMDNEYDRASRYEKWYIEEYFTNINGYCSLAEQFFQKLRSHMSPFKKLIKKGISSNHPTSQEYQTYDIKPKTPIEASVWGNTAFQRHLDFDYGDDDCVTILYQQLQIFFEREEKLLALFERLKEAETEAQRNIEITLSYLHTARDREWKSNKELYSVMSKEKVDEQRKVNPVYIAMKECESEEEFAPLGYHKYNLDDKQIFFLIMYCDMIERNFDPTEMDLWGQEEKRIKSVRYVIEHFDELLPIDYKRDYMGRFIYYMFRWAEPKTLKGFVNYFKERYQGNYKKHIPQYAAIDHCKEKFNMNNVEYKAFIDKIKYLTSQDSKTDFKKEFEELIG